MDLLLLNNINPVNLFCVSIYSPSRELLGFCSVALARRLHIRHSLNRDRRLLPAK